MRFSINHFRVSTLPDFGNVKPNTSEEEFYDLNVKSTLEIPCSFIKDKSRPFSVSPLEIC
jgi:hypothetical protein